MELRNLIWKKQIKKFYFVTTSTIIRNHCMKIFWVTGYLHDLKVSLLRLLINHEGKKYYYNEVYSEHHFN